MDVKFGAQFSSISQIYVEYLLNVGHCVGFLFHVKGACLFFGVGPTQMVFMEVVRGGSEQEDK